MSLWRIRQHLQRRGGFVLDVDLDLPASGYTVVFGPSGSGKTTLLRAVAGLEPEATGLVDLDGTRLQDQDAGLCLPAHRRDLGVVFQAGGLLPHLDVGGNLDYAVRRASRKVADRAEVISLLDLGSLLARRPHELSGGQVQRVALARALLSGPRALLLDEPFASLDRRARRSIYPYLIRIVDRFDLPSLHVTHDLEEAARLGNHLVLLEEGRVLNEGPLGDMLVDLDAGLATDPEAWSVLEVEADGPVDHDGLLRTRWAGTHIWVSADPPRAAGPLRVMIRARDVSLALDRARETSILNILPMTVSEVREGAGGRVTVRLERENQILLAAVTRRSALTLGLEKGGRVHAQIKSLSLL